MMRVLLAMLLMFFVVTHSFAAPVDILPSAFVQTWVNCAAGGDMQPPGGGAGAATCQREFDGPYGFTGVYGSVNSLSTQGVPRFEFALRGESTDPLVNDYFRNGRAYVHISYFFVVEAYAETPFAIDLVPLLFNTQVDTDASEDANVHGLIAFNVDPWLSATIDNGNSSFSSNEGFDFAPDLVGQITMESMCDTQISGPGSTFCSMVVESSISFDQQAFDEIHGDSSFLLDDYFRIRYSENILATPLPAAGWLFLSGLLCAARLGRRRQARHG